MLTNGFPDRAWSCLMKRLRPKDIRQLRLVSTTCLKATRELRPHSAKEFQKIVANTTDARSLIRLLHVPKALRLVCPNDKTIEIKMPDYVPPTQWNISNMTMLSYMSTPADLRSVFHCLDAVDFFDPTMAEWEMFIQSRMEFGCKVTAKANANGVRKEWIQECVHNACRCLNVFFPGILDIHFEDFCRGDPTFAEVKATKREQPSKTTFRNQCTMRVCMDFSNDARRNGQEWNIINLKMFQNGKIQMTGCQSFEQARECVQFLIDKLMTKASVMRIKRDCMTAIRCHQFMKKAALLTSSVRRSFAQLPKDVLIEVMLYVNNETLFACRETCRRFQSILEDDGFWISKCSKELRCHVAQTESGKYYMSEKFNGRFNRMETVKKQEYFLHPRHLYCRHRSLRPHKPFIVAEKYEKLFVAGDKVVMMNTDFKTNFELNLVVLCKILRREYGLQASYSPDSYAAINVKYVSPIAVEVEDTIDGDDGDTRISFFIFRTGSVIINSARSVEQQTEAYEFLNTIFAKHYTRIWHAPT